MCRHHVRGKSGLGGTHLVLRRTMSGSLNPILADADAGVVSIVVVVGDKCFVRCGELAAAALSTHSTQPCDVTGQSLHSFNFPCIRVGTGHTCALLRLQLAVLGCMWGRGGHAECGAESRFVSVSSPIA
jgi:hypothetical protein